MEDKNITSAALVLYMNVYVPSTHLLVIFMDLILLFATYLVLKENNLQFVPSGLAKICKNGAICVIFMALSQAPYQMK